MVVVLYYIFLSYIRTYLTICAVITILRQHCKNILEEGMRHEYLHRVQIYLFLVLIHIVNCNINEI